MFLNNETHFPLIVNMEMGASARKILLSFKILYNRICTNLINVSLINFNLLSAVACVKEGDGNISESSAGRSTDITLKIYSQ